MSKLSKQNTISSCAEEATSGQGTGYRGLCPEVFKREPVGATDTAQLHHGPSIRRRPCVSDEQHNCDETEPSHAGRRRHQLQPAYEAGLAVKQSVTTGADANNAGVLSVR